MCDNWRIRYSLLAVSCVNETCCVGQRSKFRWSMKQVSHADESRSIKTSRGILFFSWRFFILSRRILKTSWRIWRVSNDRHFRLFPPIFQIFAKTPCTPATGFQLIDNHREYGCRRSATPLHSCHSSGFRLSYRLWQMWRNAAIHLPPYPVMNVQVSSRLQMWHCFPCRNVRSLLLSCKWNFFVYNELRLLLQECKEFTEIKIQQVLLLLETEKAYIYDFLMW